METPSDFIFHIDLDCFFAAVAVLDNPELKGRPIIIGANPKDGKGRGVVSTCSYEARKFGIHSAMPISQAWRRCPQGIYMRPNFKRVKDISHQVMAIIQSYSSKFEQTSIDEAYIDCTQDCNSFSEAYQIASSLKEEVKEKCGVTCSVGVSFSKTLAKIGSDCHKPDGITVLTPKNYKKVLGPLKITRIPGIGKKTKLFYIKRGFKQIGDLYKYKLPTIRMKLGENGVWAWYSANGLDNRKVHDGTHSRKPKSVSKERTFHEDTDDISTVVEKIRDLNLKIHQKLQKDDIYYRTITIKIRFEGFQTYTRSNSIQTPMRNQDKAFEIALDLIEEFKTSSKKIRLIGLKFSNFGPILPSHQKTLLAYM